MSFIKNLYLKEQDTTVQIIIADNATKAVNRLFQKYNTGQVYKTPIRGFMLSVSMNRYHFIIDKEDVDYNTICHELLHLTLAITSERNIFEEEPRAWLQGYLANEIFSFLEEKKIKIKIKQPEKKTW